MGQTRKGGYYMRLDDYLTAEEMKLIEQLKNRNRMEIDEILGNLEKR